MVIGTAMIYISLIVILAVCVGGILLQIFLSRRESWWPGLLLPLLTFLYSLLAVFSVVITDSMGGWRYLQRSLQHLSRQISPRLYCLLFILPAERRESADGNWRR